MKITLVTAVDPFSPTDPGKVIQPPLGIACLTAALRHDGHDVTVVDSVGAAPDQIWSLTARFHYRGLKLEEIVARIPEETEVVGISLMYSCAYPGVRALTHLIREKRRNARIICGGEAFSAVAADLIDEVQADAITVGEGETPLRRFVTRLEAGEPFDDIPNLVTRGNHGQVLIKPSATAEKAPEVFPTPDWSDIHLENYWAQQNISGPNWGGRYLPLTATRGCAFRCKFCTSPSTWGFQRYRPPEDVIDEMAELKARWKIDFLVFNDLSISTDIRWFEDFVEKLAAADLGLSWMVPSGVRAQRLSIETLTVAKRAGLRHLTVNPETGSEKVMTWLEKRFSLDSVRETVVNAKKVGLSTTAFFIIGLPVEELEDYRQTVKFAVELSHLGVDEADVSIFSLYPGSPRFLELQAKGEIVMDDDYYADLLASGEELRYMRLHFLMAFYGAKVAQQPRWLLDRLFNAATGKQDLRFDRVLSKDLGRIARGVAPVASPRSALLAQRIWA
jgi:anaerobic magnesium-protoporphyrin IX monomethyl ester cyclase